VRPHSLAIHACAAAVLLVAGCASGPSTPRTPAPDRDGPEANPPPDLMQVPDAEPRVEPIRIGGPNKPYEVLGRSYTPLAADRAFSERGLASWYGRKFHGRPTASGETYNMYAMTAAHPTLPIPSYVRVRNPANAREVIVRVNDRGPFHPGRVVDLSYTAALKLGVLKGVAPVEIERLTHDEIRAGSWRHEAPASDLARVQPESEPAQVVATTLVAPVSTSPAPAAAQPVPHETSSAPVPGAVGFWVQLGAFRDRDGAVSFQRRVASELETLAPMLAIFNERALHRLQAGPYASRSDATLAAERLRAALELVPVIVQRR
jgi:rare lipoprotein A